MSGPWGLSATVAARRPALGLGRLDAGLLVRAVALALACAVGARLGLAFEIVHGAASPMWPPAGFAVFALFAEPVLWPAVVVGSIAANLWIGTPPTTAALVGIGAAGEALVAVALLRRAGFRPQLDRPIDVLFLGILGSAVPAAITATLGIGVMVAVASTPASEVGIRWLTWWLADALRILVIAGVLGAWAWSSERRRAVELVEPAFWIGAIAVAAVVLFFDVLDLRAEGQSVAFPIIPLIIVVAFRVGPRWNAVAGLVYSAVAVLATADGRGPFVGATPEASALYLGAFIALTWMTGAAVAAAIAQRESARDALEKANLAANDALARLAAVETIGRSLSESGPTAEALDTVVGLLHDVFGYEFPSIYVGDERGVRLGAQRGYEVPIDAFDGSTGVIGRTMRSHETVLVPDVAADPDFIRADAGVVSEIAVPLRSAGRLLGVVSVESRRTLTGADVASVTVVADRIAAAVALALEREALAERAAMFRSVVDYSALVSSVLAEPDLGRVVVAELGTVVPADLVGLTLAEADGRFVVRAEEGSIGAVGQIVEPGAGASGRAILERRLVEIAGHTRASFPPTVRANPIADAYADVIAVPLLREGAVLGALTVGRVDGSFRDLEREILELVGHEVALAVANARAHAAVAELATHDPLTGLHNRRYFDDAVEQILARQRRLPSAERPPLAAILFDLDKFGDFNVQHGHRVGDDVLRTFAGILRSRVRDSDLVARYGGEEFIGILPGATREDALRIAEEIRETLAATPVGGIDGQPLQVTVSAGVTEIGEADPSTDALIRAADVGLFMAKRSGRDRVVAA